MFAKKSFIKWIIVAFVLVAAFAAGIRFSFLATNRIAPGVQIAEIKLSGLKLPEARARLDEWSRSRLTESLEVTIGSRKWAGVLRDMGVVADIDRMLRSAYAIGRQGSLLTRLEVGLGFNPPDPSALYRCDREKVDSLIAKINAAVTTPAKNAKMSFTNGVRTIIPEVLGTTVDPKSSYDLIKSAIERGDSSVNLHIALDTPEVTTAELEQVDTQLATYTTRFPAWRKDRTHNVKLAAAAINGRLLRPGEIFSYNQVVGPRLKKTGYKEAQIYSRGEIIPGVGGGICQVSSTVYNAALLANLEIIERSNHSMPVPYVPLGRDATVAYGIRDLKFKNITSAPVYIATRIEENRLTVDVYGTAIDKKEVSIVTTKPKRMLIKNGKRITAVTVYRIVHAGGVEAQKKKVSYDRYSPAPPHPASATSKSKPITKPKPVEQQVVSNSA